MVYKYYKSANDEEVGYWCVFINYVSIALIRICDMNYECG